MRNAVVVSAITFPCVIRRNQQHCTVDLLTSNLSQTGNATFTNPTSDLELLERSLSSVSEMLDRVLSYVQSVLSGEVKGDAAVGRYLLDALGPSTEDLEKGEFNSHLQVRQSLASLFATMLIQVQDTLMVSYLANLVRSQAEVSSRLALVKAS